MLTFHKHTPYSTISSCAESSTQSSMVPTQLNFPRCHELPPALPQPEPAQPWARGTALLPISCALARPAASPHGGSLQAHSALQLQRTGTCCTAGDSSKLGLSASSPLHTPELSRERGQITPQENTTHTSLQPRKVPKQIRRHTVLRMEIPNYFSI